MNGDNADVYDTILCNKLMQLKDNDDLKDLKKLTRYGRRYLARYSTSSRRCS